MRIKILKVSIFVLISILILHINTLGFSIFDYNADSKALYEFNENIEVSESNSSDFVLLSTSTEQKSKHIVFMANIPCKGVVTSEFGFRWGRDHKGFDIAANEGTGIHAAANGVVEYASELDTYGLMVKINHGNGFETIYAHCSKIDVEVGQLVTRGDKIAEMGNTGDSTGDHLHFEVILNGIRVNPRDYFLQTPNYDI